ncbi:class II aldolase/adducin family protein [Leptospira ilyithenensis]|uniref:Class II aldolase/adducin family protein n=1 Tax=Leptospira ilyithenensis TaxID=2484901 RepID=A0A4R9LLN8_9LEPT|nr:class II aldolase/adducin family protein [Leptospira ilyithenensis]TGN08492.1 class II aldolase/adducin family protein [Leptospira ilyithenensis]
MEIQTANKIVRDTGVRLLKAGLITRTWGNISQRIDEDHFVITPTGRTYEDLSPDEIVKVNLHTLEHEGRIKPSYEKGLHAETYKLRPDVKSIIHTHQLQASVVASARKNIPILSDKMKKIIGGPVFCTDYALPGSKKLIRSAIECLAKSGSKAVLLANHGVLCIGSDMENAFSVSMELEKSADAFIREEFKKISHAKKFETKSVREWYLQNFGKKEFA